MSWLALSAALALWDAEPADAPQWWSGRLVTDDVHQVHVGVRPHLSLDNEGDGSGLELGVGVTVQLTLDVL